jgi:hypothetical protein
MEDKIVYGLDLGTFLYYNGSWAKIIKEHNEFGIQWCGDWEKVMGLNASCLKRDGREPLWKVAGEKGCPKVPEKYNYEPPNNQRREFCFWHPKVKTKTKYIKTLDIIFYYCPECKR